MLVHWLTMNTKKYQKMLFASNNACACGQRFDSDRAFRAHKRSCDSMRCCGRQFGDVVALRKHTLCHQDQKDQTTKPRGSKSVASNPPLTHAHNIPYFFTCKFCKRADFKSAKGLGIHQRGFCKEFKLSQVRPVLNSVPFQASPGADLPSAIKDPKQPHSVSARLIPNQDPRPRTPDFTSFDKLPRINLPRASDHKTWSHLASQITHTLHKEYTTHISQTQDVETLMDSFTNSVREILIRECGEKTNKPHKKHVAKEK